MILWILVLISMHAHGANFDAEQVIVRAPEAPALEYQSYLLATGNRKSPSKSYLSEHPSRANRARFLKSLAQAQEKFLAGSTHEAADAFRLVLSLAAEEDWSASEREALVYSAIRLSQLVTTEEEKNSYLKLSLNFGPDIQPDPQLFPPPLLTRRNELSDQMSKTPLNTQNLRNRFSWLILNGYRINLSEVDHLKIFDGRYRMTLISDIYPAQTHLGDVRELESLVEDHAPLVRGQCSRHAESEFFGMDCSQKYESVKISPEPVSLPPEMRITTTTSKPFYKKGWFWAGVGVAAAVLVLSQKKTEESSPHTTYGF